MLEKEVERKLIQPIRNMGGLCLKFETPGYTGMPDRIILLPGAHLVFVETKQRGKKERARQVLVQEIFRKLGFMVFSSIDTPAKVAQVVEYCRKAVNEE